METETKVMYNSPEAASLQTVTGWVSRTGRFWGNDEHMARWEGATHDVCKCGKEKNIRGYTICDDCLAKQRHEKFLAMPEKKLEYPVCIFNDDTYFFDEDSLLMHCEENEIEPTELKLQLCQPNYPAPISSDIWEDIFAEDGDYPELEKMIDEFNKKLKTLPALSWSPVNIRTVYEKE